MFDDVACRLEARLEANPPPRLTWTTAGRQIHPSGRHDIRYDNGIVVLLINNVQPQDAGEYQLRASNELGEISCKTVLNIRREFNVLFPFLFIVRDQGDHLRVGLPGKPGKVGEFPICQGKVREIVCLWYATALAIVTK